MGDKNRGKNKPCILEFELKISKRIHGFRRIYQELYRCKYVDICVCACRGMHLGYIFSSSVFVSHDCVTPLPFHEKPDFIFSHFTYLLKTSLPYNKFPNHIQLHQPNTQLQQGWEGEKKRKIFPLLNFFHSLKCNLNQVHSN